MTDLHALSQSLAALAQGAAAAVLGLDGPRSRLSAFAWKDDLAVTAEEGLEDDEGLSLLLPDGTRAPATLLGRDPSTDVALLRADRALPPPLPWDDGPRAAGEVALAVGRAEGGPIVAWGAIGHAGPAWRSLRGGRIDARLDLDLRLRGHAQGGLAVTAEGRAFGMAARGPRGTALAIPAATVARVAGHLLAHGRVARGYLGVSLQPVRTAEGWGAMILGVEEGGPAHRAGVLQGDVILRIGGEPVEGGRGLARRLGPEAVGTAVTLDLLRGGEPVTLAVAVAERPA